MREARVDRGHDRDFSWEVNHMAVQLGKRYICETCGTEVLCNKPGNGSILCCEKEMGLKEAKPLPSSD